MQHGQDALLVLKTGAAAFDDLEERLRQLHPYDVLEILAMPVIAGSPAYLAWLADSVTPPGGEDVT